MKNLLISFLALAIACLAVSTASAEPTYEKTPDVGKIVIKNERSGYRWFLKEFEKPATTLLKTCNGDARYICVYEIKKGKEIALYKFRDDGWTVAHYDLRYEVASADLADARVIVTPTKISVPNCQDILSFSRALPLQERLSRTGLLQQVADCTR